MMKNSLAEKIGEHRSTQGWHIRFKVEPWIFFFYFVCLVLCWRGDGGAKAAPASSVSPLGEVARSAYEVCSVFWVRPKKTMGFKIFWFTQINNGVQIFRFTQNNDSKCVICRNKVQIILISEIKAYLKVQLLLSVRGMYIEKQIWLPLG